MAKVHFCEEEKYLEFSPELSEEEDYDDDTHEFHEEQEHVEIYHSSDEGETDSDEEPYKLDFKEEEEQLDFEDILRETLKIDINDDSMYYLYLLNVFTKYYNLKFNKNENFFSGILDPDSDTTPMMELFYECIHAFKEFQDKYHLSQTEIMQVFIMKENFDDYTQSEFSKKYFHFEEMIKEPNNTIYTMELYMDNKKISIISPLLIVCLNYLIEHNIDYTDDVCILNINYN